MNNINNVKPQNQLINNPRPANGAVLNINPNNQLLQSPNVIYTENRTILKGQPLPWGLNWLITYPIQLTFTGVRL